MILRPATERDVAAAAEIYDMARGFMKGAGNPTQWAGVYPSGADVIEGIGCGESFVVEEDGEIVATLQFRIGREPCYDNIYGGSWKNGPPYAVIHRIAVKHHGRGIVDFCFSECFRLCPNLKIDTHRDNIPMQRVLARAGFEYCGIIRLENGEERLAFQKTEG